MNASPRRALVIALSLVAATFPGCARVTPLAPRVELSAAREKELFDAYFRWRQAVTCATTAAPRSIDGIGPALDRGQAALDRLAESGPEGIIARFETRYREIDSLIDWSCGHGDQLAPPDTDPLRREALTGAAAGLAEAIDRALATR